MQKIQTVQEAVHAYVVARRNAYHPISTLEATSAIRILIPHAEHTDAAIGELVAAAAVKEGITVYFDARFSETKTN